jgi:hypothetical protein
MAQMTDFSFYEQPEKLLTVNPLANCRPDNYREPVTGIKG